MTSKEISQIAFDALEDKKGYDVKGIDIHELTVIADAFVLAKALNSTHARTLADEVDHRLEEAGARREGIDGYRTDWILLDYGNVMIHIFYGDENGGYDNLSRLWADAKEMDFSKENQKTGGVLS